MSSSGTVLLIGDSIFDCHEGEKRLEVVLKAALEKASSQAKWTVVNYARGGEYIGPKEGEPQGTTGPLFTNDSSGRYFDVLKKCPRADIIVINYVGNDGKVYPPATFRKRLEFFCGQLEKDYPGCQIVFSTGMYLDPKHSTGYFIENPKVPGFKNGNSRNEYLEAYNKETRAFASEKGYLVAEVHRRMKRETEKGNWDFRVRVNGSDPKDDAKHEGDMNWFNDIHPNDRGTALIAEVIAECVTGKR